MIHDINELKKNEQVKLENNLINVVDSQLELGVSYLLLLVSSSIIATLGLLIDSTAVVIGAMIITPLFWPVLGITLGLITTRHHLIGKATRTFILSIVLVLFVGAFITIATPISTITNEIRARTNPTVIDLLIALFTSFIGVAAIYYPGISSSKTGVAISISMLPPLCVSSIGIAIGSFDIFVKSFILFLANVSAIIFAGIITLYILKVRPKFKDDKKRLKIGFILSCVFIIILSLPLFYYFRHAIYETQITNAVETSLPILVDEANLKTKYDESFIRIKSINITEPTILKNDPIYVQVYVEVPEDVYLDSQIKTDLVYIIEQKISKPIEISLNIVKYKAL